MEHLLVFSITLNIMFGFYLYKNSKLIKEMKDQDKLIDEIKSQMGIK